jgi:uncharacterized coiled-coil DUF342 family protein
MNDCNFSAKHEILEHDIKNLKLEIKELDVRLRMNENKADVTASKLDTIIESIKNINSKLDELTKVPARRWETLIGVGITVIVTAMLTYFIKR